MKALRGGGSTGITETGSNDSLGTAPPALAHPHTEAENNYRGPNDPYESTPPRDDTDYAALGTPPPALAHPHD